MNYFGNIDYNKMNGIGEFRNLVRPDLADHCPASNLALNEKIKKMIKEGRKVYHFGFGQAPFPLVDSAVDALREYVKETAYLPVAGRFNLSDVEVAFVQCTKKVRNYKNHLSYVMLVFI